MSDLFDALPLGTRVVVRHRLPTADGQLSDALGELIEVAPGPAGRTVVIRTRRGDVRILTSAITHAKPAPPPPPRRAPRRSSR